MASINYGTIDNTWIDERIRERGSAAGEKAAIREKLPQIFLRLEAAIRRQVEHYLKGYAGSAVEIQTVKDQLTIRQTAPVLESVTITKDLKAPALIATYENPARSVVIKLKGDSWHEQKFHAIASQIMDPLLFPDLQS